MSADTTPISPARFAAALRDLSLPTLHLKVLEIRNSILHLRYSNAQLAPYAEGSATTLDAADAAAGRPDPTCVEAIRENEAVIARMEERVAIIRAEVEGRGCSWDEFKSKDEVDAESGTAATTNGAAATTTNGVEAAREEEERIAGRTEATTTTTTTTTTGGSQHPAWMDGTFQTGTIRNGEIQMDAQPGQRANGTAAGGRLTDEELRRAMEERMRGLGGDDNDDDGGMHL